MKDTHLVELLTGIEEYERMSTATYRQAVDRDLVRRGTLPALASLTARDFKVCEICGGPAMLHPRFEMAQIVSGEKQVLCCDCLHELVAPPTARKGKFRPGDQLWQCRRCETERAWGLMTPADRKLVPALECSHCQASTRHVYLRVA